MKEYKVGDEIETLQGYKVTIVDIVKSSKPKGSNNPFDYTVQFENGLELFNITQKLIDNRNIQYPFHPTVFGVGYIGVGKYTSTTKDSYRSTAKGLSKAYATWQGMLGRCYCPIVQKRQPTYKGDTVHPYWHNYQNYAKWFYGNYVEGFGISKNIFYKKCTVYSEKTCCFVPMDISNAFIKRKTNKSHLPIGVDMSSKTKFSSSITTIKYTKDGVVHNTEFFGTFDVVEDAFIPYKQAKEKQLRYYASFWKDLLKPDVQEALRNHKVEIDD